MRWQWGCSPPNSRNPKQKTPKRRGRHRSQWWCPMRSRSQQANSLAHPQARKSFKSGTKRNPQSSNLTKQQNTSAQSPQSSLSNLTSLPTCIPQLKTSRRRCWHKRNSRSESWRPLPVSPSSSLLRELLSITSRVTTSLTHSPQPSSRFLQWCLRRTSNFQPTTALSLRLAPRKTLPQ